MRIASRRLGRGEREGEGGREQGRRILLFIPRVKRTDSREFASSSRPETDSRRRYSNDSSDSDCISFRLLLVVLCLSPLLFVFSYFRSSSLQSDSSSLIIFSAKRTLITIIIIMVTVQRRFTTFERSESFCFRSSIVISAISSGNSVLPCLFPSFIFVCLVS